MLNRVPSGKNSLGVNTTLTLLATDVSGFNTPKPPPVMIVAVIAPPL